MKKKSTNRIALVIGITLIVLGTYFPGTNLAGWGGLLLITLGCMVYFKKRKPSLSAKRAPLHIELLKREMRSTQAKIDLLKDYQERGEVAKYQRLSQEVLEELEEIEDELRRVGPFIDASDQARIVGHIAQTKLEIEENRFGQESGRRLDTREGIGDWSFGFSARQVERSAPDIFPYCKEIEQSHQGVLAKISEYPGGNRQELLQAHEKQMARYKDVVEAYLAMKEDPASFSNVEDRLEQARLVLKRFDENLRQVLLDLGLANRKEAQAWLEILSRKL